MPTVAQIEAAAALTPTQAERLRGLIAAASIFQNCAGIFADLATRLAAQVQRQSGVTGATNAAPIVLSVAAHPFDAGESVFVSGVTGNTAANSSWVLGAITTTTLELRGSVGNAAYVSGGLVASLTSKTLAAIALALESCSSDSTTKVQGGSDGVDHDPQRDRDELVRQALGLLYAPDELAQCPYFNGGAFGSVSATNRATW